MEPLDSAHSASFRTSTSGAQVFFFFVGAVARGQRSTGHGVEVDDDDLERAGPDDFHGSPRDLVARRPDDEHPIQLDSRSRHPRRVERSFRIEPCAPRPATAFLSCAHRGEGDARGPAQGTGGRELHDPPGKAPVWQEVAQTRPGKDQSRPVVPGICAAGLGAQSFKEGLDVVRRCHD